MTSPRDLIVAGKARGAGARWCLRIISESRKQGIPVSLGFALVEQESGFRNVYGSDPTIFVGAGAVTKRNYLAYKAKRGHTHMQGVGPTQLTWWATQDQADKQGGCWRPGVNIKVGIGALGALVRAKGVHAGAAAYNGSGPAAQRYADQLITKQRKWHKTLA